jgi:hypothetical protein
MVGNLLFRKQLEVGQIFKMNQNCQNPRPAHPKRAELWGGLAPGSLSGFSGDRCSGWRPRGRAFLGRRCAGPPPCDIPLLPNIDSPASPHTPLPHTIRSLATISPPPFAESAGHSSTELTALLSGLRFSGLQTCHLQGLSS